MGYRCASARPRQTVSLSPCQSAVSALIGRADAGRQESRVRYHGFSARRFTLLRTVRGNRQRKIHQTMRRLAVHDPSLIGALGGRRRCVLEQLNDAKCIRKILRHMFRRLPLRVKSARASQAGVCSHSLKSDCKVKSLLECRNHNQLCLRQNTCIKIFIKIPRHHYKY